MHGAPGRIAPPDDDIFCFDKIFRIVAPHVAEVVILGVDPRRPARRPHKTGGIAQRGHHPLYAIIGDPEVAGIFGQAQTQQTAVALFYLKDFVCDAIHGLIPGNATPVTGTPLILNHRILDTIRTVEPPRIGIAFHTQRALGKGGLRRAFHKLHYAVPHIGFYAAGIIAVSRAGVAEYLIRTGIKGRRRRVPGRQQTPGQGGSRSRRQQPLEKAAPIHGIGTPEFALVHQHFLCGLHSSLSPGSASAWFPSGKGS